MDKQELELQTIETTNNAIEYSGQITVSALDGDRVISKQTYYNNGTNKLFSFLSNCLSGDFNTARASRPCRLLLLKTDNTENTTNSKPTDTNYSDFWDVNYYAAPPVYYSKTPAVVGGKITYNFRVPFLILENGVNIKKMALVPEASNNVDDISAYYILDDSIQVPTNGGNFTILVDWELSFANKQRTA